MTFSLAGTLKERLANEPVVALPEPKNDCVLDVSPSRQTKPQDGKKNSKPASSKTVVVSFRYTGQAPQFSEVLIRKLLQQYNKRNPVEAVRVFRNKFYVDFSVSPDHRQIQSIFQQHFDKVEVFVHYDVPNQQDLNTVYLGRIRGCDVATLTQASLQFVKDVKQVRIPAKEGRPQNFGYVECNCREDALLLAKKLNGMALGLSDGVRAVPMVAETDK